MTGTYSYTGEEILSGAYSDVGRENASGEQRLYCGVRGSYSAGRRFLHCNRKRELYRNIVWNLYDFQKEIRELKAEPILDQIL